MTDEDRKALVRYMKGECRQSYMDRSCRIDANKLAEAAAQIEADGQRIAELEAALRDIATGRYSGVVLTSIPPKDAVVERARAALGDKQ